MGEFQNRFGDELAGAFRGISPWQMSCPDYVQSPQTQFRCQVDLQTLTGALGQQHHRGGVEDQPVGSSIQICGIHRGVTQGAKHGPVGFFSGGHGNIRAILPQKVRQTFADPTPTDYQNLQICQDHRKLVHGDLQRAAGGNVGVFGQIIGILQQIPHLVTGQIQISAKASIDRIKDEAYDLGMVKAGAEQMHLISLPTGYGDTTAQLAMTIAQNKTKMPFMDALIKGIGCNILVCAGVWMASGASSAISKAALCFFPVMLFVLCGLEHSIANMYYIPAGMLAGADVTIGAYLLNNLLPVTLGNVIGGAGFAAAYCQVYRQ